MKLLLSLAFEVYISIRLTCIVLHCLAIYVQSTIPKPTPILILLLFSEACHINHHSTTHPPLAHAIPYIYQPKFQTDCNNSLILVCMKCETALGTAHSTILQHCRNITHREQERVGHYLEPEEEKVSPPDEHLLTICSDEVEILSNYILKHPTDNPITIFLRPANIPLPTVVIPQLPHLKLWNVQVCSCGDIHLSAKSLQAHHVGTGHFGVEEKTAQQYARMCKYFLVTPASVDPAEDTCLLQYLSAAQISAKQSSSVVVYDSNPRVIAPWLREHNFHLLMEGKDPQVHLKALAPVMAPSQRGSVKPASIRVQLIAIIAYISFIDANCTRKTLSLPVLDLFTSTFPWAQRPAGERAHLKTLEDVWTLV